MKHKRINIDNLTDLRKNVIDLNVTKAVEETECATLIRNVYFPISKIYTGVTSSFILLNNKTTYISKHGRYYFKDECNQITKIPSTDIYKFIFLT